METLFAFLFVFALVATIVFGVLCIISKVRKTPNKRFRAFLFASIGVTVTAFIVFAIISDVEPSREPVSAAESSDATPTPEPPPADELTPTVEPYIPTDSVAEPADDDTYISAPVDYSLGTAFVSAVIDGDTIEIAGGERVRLIGINAPEIGEPGADEATQFVRDTVLRQTVWLEASGNDRDRHERLRRYVWIEYPSDTECEIETQEKQLNAMLLANGLAAVFIVSDNQDEADADDITSPGNGGGNGGGVVRHDNPEQITRTAFVLNASTMRIHGGTCSNVRRIAPENYDTIYDFDEAIRRGFVACRRCNPR